MLGVIESNPCIFPAPVADVLRAVTFGVRRIRRLAVIESLRKATAILRAPQHARDQAPRHIIRFETGKAAVVFFRCDLVRYTLQITRTRPSLTELFALGKVIRYVLDGGIVRGCDHHLEPREL